MDYTTVFSLIIAIIGALITAVFVPYIRTKVSSDELSMIYSLVKIAVSAAEQIYGGKHGQEKKQYVIDYLASKGIFVDADFVSSEFNAMIEAAVYELSRGQEAESGGAAG